MSSINSEKIIAAAAVAARAKFEDDDEAAAGLIVEKALHNPALRDALLWSAARAAVAIKARVIKAKIWNPTPPKMVFVPTGRGGYIQRLKERAIITKEVTLLNFTLPTEGKKRLKNATKPEIMAGADAYAAQSSDMNNKALFLRMVADLVPAGKTAGDVLSEEKLRQIQTLALKKTSEKAH